MRPLRLLLAISSCLFAILLVSWIAASKTHITATSDERNNRLGALFNWRSPSSLFPPSAIISLTDENSTFFLARPAAYGPLLPSKGLSGQLWIGSGFGDDHLGHGGALGAEGELGCSDVPGWSDDDYRATSVGSSGVSRDTKASPEDDNPRHNKRSTAGEKTSVDVAGNAAGQDDGTDDHLHHPSTASGGLRTSEKAEKGKKPGHADIQSLQESAEIAGKVVLLSRGGCGFLEKSKWVQRRGGTALIVGDDTRGGPLVTMYARGDTSNITIPSIFTSHMTAHLLSTLVPSGGLVDDISLEEAARLGHALGDKIAQTGSRGKMTNKDGRTGERAVFTATPAVAGSNGRPKQDAGHKAASLEELKAQEDEADWLRALFADSAAGISHGNSRRPPSSGNIDWVVQEDFNEEESHTTTPVIKATTSTKRATQTRKATPAAKGKPDAFVIGVQDWRDPDLVETGVSDNDALTNVSADQERKALNHGKPKGGSITPGSGEYGSHDKKVPTPKAQKQSEQQSTKKLEHLSGKEDAHADFHSEGWISRLSWSDDKAALESNLKSTSKQFNGKITDEDRRPQHPHQEEDDDNDRQPHDGLWVTLTPTTMSSSPFFDTLLVLVVSPLVTLTVVYALLLLRSRIRRRRWRAPKSVVERLPVRTYHTIPSATGSAAGSSGSAPSPPSTPTSTTPLLRSGARTISATRTRPRSRTTSEVPAAGSSFGQTNVPSLDQIQEKREAGLSEWRRRYGGKQRECVVCLEEYVDGVSRVMSLPCGHEFHAECITPWLTTRRRTCPICKGDVVRSLARTNAAPSATPALYSSHDNDDDDDDDDEHGMDAVQEQAAGTRNDDPAAAEPVSRDHEAFEDLEQGLGTDRDR